MKKLISGLIIATVTVFVLGLAAILILAKPQAPVEPGNISFQIYYYNPDLDKDESGNILCGSGGLVGVWREAPAGSELVAAAVSALLDFPPRPEELAAGLTSEYPLSGLQVLSLSLKEGGLTLELADPENRTSGGACRAGILRAQLEATLSQFPGVNAVVIEPEYLFQP